MRIRAGRLPHIRVGKLRRHAPFFYAVLFLAGMLAILIVIDVKIDPLVREYAYNRAVYLATNTLNDAVNEALDESGVSYGDIVHLITDGEGNVTALISDSVTINALKTKIISGVLERLEGMEETRLKIPLGAVTGVNLLSGAGPRMSISVVPLGTATAQFGSDFHAAGINQTVHKVRLEVTAYVTILLGGRSVNTEISTQVDVAETVIVGSVPDSYTNVEDASGGETTDKIFNFAGE